MESLSHINLQLGWPTPALFPGPYLLESATEVLQTKKKADEALLYGPDAGYASLRHSTAKWLNSLYRPEIETTAPNICVTNGASPNLANMMLKFTEPGYTRRVWMIEPSYFRACAIFTDCGYGGRLRGVPEDEEGIDISFLRSSLEACEAAERSAGINSERKKLAPRYPKLYRHVIYTVPTFSNPSGKVMSLRRRKQLVALAREFDALVITDDVYEVLRWPAHPSIKASELGPMPPRLIDIDRIMDGGPKDEWGNTVSNGSYAKILAPGVRTGWADASTAFVSTLSQVGSTVSGGCPTNLSAALVSEMVDSGHLMKHLQNVIIPAFQDRYDAMLATIKVYLEPLGFSISTGRPYEEPEENADSANGVTTSLQAVGGYFLYIMVPQSLPVSPADLSKYTLERYNLRVATGDMMVVEGDESSVQRASSGFGRALRLCWAWHSKGDIVEGIKRLAQATQDMSRDTRE